MTYSIPVTKLEKLEKIIKRYQKKGGVFTFTIGDEILMDGTLYVNDQIHHKQYHEPIKNKCREVSVEGSYVINGWRFIGTIQFTENGNIIRKADTSLTVPEKYNHTPMICEHCGTIRHRKDTYLIYNETTGEFKQVGSTCLLEYTQGLDAEKCADIMSCLDKFIELSNYDVTESEFFGNSYESTGIGMSRETVLPIAYAYVKQYGYQRMENGTGTANDVLQMLWQGNSSEEMVRRYESLVMPTDEEVNSISEYAKIYINSTNEYMRNASLAWLNDSIEYRDFSLICSFVNTYLKEMAQVAVNSASSSEFVGNIGDRITITVDSARVLYTKDNSWASYYAGFSYVYEIKDVKGNIYIWTTDKRIVPENIIVATVKSHDTYKGKKQTVITRGRIQ